jgi:hypothetical protein
MRSNRERAESGSVNCIPNKFDRFSDYWAGTEQGKLYMVTAASGVGKSKLAKKLFVFDVIDQVFDHPEWNIDLHIKYFCLEESKVNFMQSLMSYKMYHNDNHRKSVTEMNSIGSTIGPDTIEKAEGGTEYWKRFEQVVDIIDDVRHPTGIFKRTEEWLEDHGKWEMVNREFTNNDTGNKYIKEVKDYYVPDHPNRYVIVIVDHISLISQEKHDGVLMSLHQSMTKLSSDYFLQLRDKYNCSIVNVQQQAAESEKQQFNFRGNSIESKLEPSLANLGDNKLTARDVDLAFGLFAPDRYEIENHMGYNVAVMQDHFRSLKILKFRDGISNIKMPLFFDGAVGCFEELPPDMEENDYTEYMRRVDF